MLLTAPAGQSIKTGQTLRDAIHHAARELRLFYMPHKSLCRLEFSFGLLYGVR